MTCDEARSLIDAFIDRELSLEASLMIERHLIGCDDCALVYKNSRAVRDLVRASSLYEQAPGYLSRRIMSAIDQVDLAESPTFSTRYVLVRQIARAVAIAAGLLIVAFISWSIGHRPNDVHSEDALKQEVFASDMRSLMAPSHGIDILSSNQHTVKPWFAGKLDFSPPVEDFTADGFPLLGGRRDYLNGRDVATLIYRRRQHWIDVYLWPSDKNAPVIINSHQGYHLIHWSGNGMTYWAVSDLNTSELNQLARLIQSEV